VTEAFILSPTGRQDMDDIWLYIAKDSPIIADRVEQELIAAMRQIGKYPQSGHFRADLTSKNVRFRSVYSYMIIYDPSTKPVHILHIISSYRDIKKQLD
jgi:plasmid stabilization system protein ParE